MIKFFFRGVSDSLRFFSALSAMLVLIFSNMSLAESISTNKHRFRHNEPNRSLLSEPHIFTNSWMGPLYKAMDKNIEFKGAETEVYHELNIKLIKNKKHDFLVLCNRDAQQPIDYVNGYVCRFYFDKLTGANAKVVYDNLIGFGESTSSNYKEFTLDVQNTSKNFCNETNCQKRKKLICSESNGDYMCSITEEVIGWDE